MADIPAPTASVFRIAIRTLYTDAAYQDSPAVIEDTIARVGEIFTIIAGDPSTQFSSAVAFQVKTKIGPALLQSWEPVVYIINSAGKSLLASRRGLKVETILNGTTIVRVQLDIAYRFT